MSSRTSHSQLWAIAAIALLGACSGQGGVDAGSSTDFQTPEDQALADGATELVAYEEFDNGVALEIVRDDTGNFVTSVGARIDAPEGSAAVMAAGTSLRELYSALSGGRSLPAELAEIETEYDAAYAVNLDDNDQPRHPSATDAIEKSESNFNSRVCTTLEYSTSSWEPKYCDYADAYFQVLTNGDFDSGNRAYYWNENNFELKLSRTGSSTLKTAKPGWWTSVTWSGSYSNKTVRLYSPEIWTPNGWFTPYGNMGVTIHEQI